jgi:hypothetical protein
MDAFELLIEDHEKVSDLFDQIEDEADDITIREQLFGQLQQELLLHSRIEEQVLYPTLRQLPNAGDLIPDAIEAHNEVKQLLTQIETLSKVDSRWGTLMEELRDAVEQHVAEEEEEIFEAAREVMSQSQIEDLGNRLLKAKEQHMVAGGGTI